MAFKDKMILKDRKKMIIPDIPKGYKSHPFSVDDYYKMPENLSGILEKNGVDPGDYDGTFIVPPQAYLKRWFGKRYVPWKALLFDHREIIHVSDTLIVDESGSIRKIYVDDLLYIKIHLCLLYGKLDIISAKKEALDKVSIEYNTVGHKLLEPQLEKFLRFGWTKSPWTIDKPDVYDRLKKIPVKYRNGVSIYVLHKGERLQDFLFMPRLVKKIGFIKMNILPDILIAITDRQLVILEDDLSPTSAYTWLLTYIPLSNFSGIKIKRSNGFTDLTIKAEKSKTSQDISIRIEDKYTDEVKVFLSQIDQHFRRH